MLIIIHPDMMNTTSTEMMMASQTEYKNIGMATPGVSYVDDNNRMMSVKAEAFASEVAHMVNEAKDVAKTLESIKATLAKLKAVSKPSTIPATPPPMVLPVKKFVVDERKEGTTTTPFQKKTVKADAMVIADEVTQFETDKAPAIARYEASWTPIESKSVVLKEVVKPTSFENKASLTVKTPSSQSSTRRDPSPSRPFKTAVLAQMIEKCEDNTVENICQDDHSTEPIAIAIVNDDAFTETSVSTAEDTNIVVQDQPNQVTAYQIKNKETMNFSADGKVTTTTSVKGVPDLSGVKKGLFESFLDSLGLAKACGIDDETLAQYVAEDDTPTTMSSETSSPKRGTVTTNPPPTYSVDHDFGFTSIDFHAVFCGDFESELAEYKDLQVYNTGKDAYVGVRSGVVSKPPKSILKLPKMETEEESRVELTVLEEPEGAVHLEVDSEEEEELEKKSVCFQGAEPDGIKAESFPSQSESSNGTIDEAMTSNTQADPVETVVMSSEESSTMMSLHDHTVDVVETIKLSSMNKINGSAVTEHQSQSELELEREDFMDEGIGHDVFEDDKGDFLDVLDDHLSCT